MIYKKDRKASMRPLLHIMRRIGNSGLAEIFRRGRECSMRKKNTASVDAVEQVRTAAPGTTQLREKARINVDYSHGSANALQQLAKREMEVAYASGRLRSSRKEELYTVFRRACSGGKFQLPFEVIEHICNLEDRAREQGFLAGFQAGPRGQ